MQRVHRGIGREGPPNPRNEGAGMRYRLQVEIEPRAAWTALRCIAAGRVYSLSWNGQRLSRGHGLRNLCDRHPDVAEALVVYLEGAMGVEAGLSSRTMIPPAGALAAGPPTPSRGSSANSAEPSPRASATAPRQVFDSACLPRFAKNRGPALLMPARPLDLAAPAPRTLPEVR